MCLSLHIRYLQQVSIVMFALQYPTCPGGLTCEAQKLGWFTIIHRKLWSYHLFSRATHSVIFGYFQGGWLVIVSTATGVQRMSVTCEWLQD
jgi:hypothetical protein